MASIAAKMNVIVPEIMEHSEVDTVAKEVAQIVLGNPGQSENMDLTIGVPSNAESGETEVKVTISSLPTELHIKIFNYLDRASSTCFGLTAKNYYPIHKDLRGIVPLTACCLQYPSRASSRILFGLLKEWMKGVGLDFSKSELKFLTLERKLEIKAYDAWWHMVGHAHPSPKQLKLAKAKEKRKLEILRDEKEAGGWWEKGVWVDGVKSGKGTLRWIELGYEGVEWEGDENAPMNDTAWW
ncbi:hypothetical protein N431DRAFT_531266 [Stipitochalara longipes BDJ]|nr:hypothetical protein N431DRAFT_531266 [Stipitochalara longipes BDJ]